MTEENLIVPALFLSTDNLRKRGNIVLEWCCMCKRCEESGSSSSSLWTMVFCIFGLQWVLPMRVIDKFAAWWGSFGKHTNIAFGKAVPYCIMWCLWQERNARSFERCEWSILDFKAFFFCTLLDWSVAFHSFSLVYSFMYVWAL